MKGKGPVLTYFNCTIQELKQPQLFAAEDLVGNFNCTIQELKQHL